MVISNKRDHRLLYPGIVPSSPGQWGMENQHTRHWDMMSQYSFESQRNRRRTNEANNIFFVIHMRFSKNIMIYCRIINFWPPALEYNDNFEEKLPLLVREKVLFHHNYAGIHKCIVSMVKFCDLDHELVPDPPYFLDLSSVTISCFRNLEKWPPERN